MNSFDLTKEIQLEERWRKRYIQSRAVLFGLFAVAVIALVYVILFPSLTFDYFFHLPDDSLKNTVTSPRNATNTLIANGQVPGKNTFVFDTLVTGNFSDATVNYTLEKNSAPIQKTNLLVKRSYHSFFYPTGDPLGFRDGTLLTNAGYYFLVSDGMARKFASGDVLHTLGLVETMFLPVTADELALSKPGQDITDTATYPDGTLLKVDTTYYQFSGGKLDQFVSANAYLSRYQDSQAITKDKTFLAKYDLSQTVIGFADGTLASYGQSVFILSGGKYYPVNNPQTFEILGLNWDDVVAVTPDELAIYKKQKIFTQNDPHPDGIIFLDSKTKAYYMVEGNQKRPIIGTDLINSYLRNHPVVADSESLKITATCTLSKNIWPLNSYSCTVPLEAIKDLPGNDYQFTQTTTTAFQINQLGVTFHTSFNWPNMKDSLSHIKRSITSTYTGQ